MKEKNTVSTTGVQVAEMCERGYKPIIYKINNDNFIETIYQFVENWYEIDILHSVVN